MKNLMIRSISLFGISLMMALSVAAQDVPKEKINDKESKYKSEDLKIKDKKEKKDKYKSDDVKIKDKKDEAKYKTADLKVKDKKDERKVKGTVKPMQITKTERTELKTGETNVKSKEYVAPIAVEPAVNEPVAEEQVTMPDIQATKKTVTRKYVAKKSYTHKAVAARKSNTARRYVVRTKIVKDTVYVPSPPERVVSTQTEYVHDTVTITRVDTVLRMQKENTYTGYRVPRGNFKKVKLKKDKDDDEVRMKTK